MWKLADLPVPMAITVFMIQLANPPILLTLSDADPFFLESKSDKIFTFSGLFASSKQRY